MTTRYGRRCSTIKPVSHRPAKPGRRGDEPLRSSQGIFAFQARSRCRIVVASGVPRLSGSGGDQMPAIGARLIGAHSVGVRHTQLSVIPGRTPIAGGDEDRHARAR
jgi:hypothetical protein